MSRTASWLRLALLALLWIAAACGGGGGGSDILRTTASATATEPVASATGSRTAPATATSSPTRAAGLVVTTLAGTGQEGFADGAGRTARFKAPAGLALDSRGTVYVADSGNHRVRAIKPDGTVTTLAGSDTAGTVDGPAAASRLVTPYGVAVDQQGVVYVADYGGHRIRTISPDGRVAPLAGSGEFGFADGPAAAAQFMGPFALAVDAGGTVYVAEERGHRIRKITRGGTVSTLAGTGQVGYADGPGRSARFYEPKGIAVDTAGNVYVADYGNNRIRKITPDGVVSTLAGTGQLGSVDGPARSAQFSAPEGIAVDRAGTLYVADFVAQQIRKITPDGTVSTVVGAAIPMVIDGQAGTLKLSSPVGVAVDAAGALYVAEFGGNRMRKIASQ